MNPIGARGGHQRVDRSAILDTKFGPTEAGLQLSVKIDAGTTVASFVVKNSGPKPVTFVESSRAGTLHHHFGFEPKVHGLTTKVETVCTRNVPTKRRLLAKGGVVQIDVPFALAGELSKTADKVFQANAALDIEGHGGLVVLHSAVQTH